MGLCVCLWGGQHRGKDFEGETWVSLETTDVEQDSGETLGCWEALGSHRISQSPLSCLRALLGILSLTIGDLRLTTSPDI